MPRLKHLSSYSFLIYIFLLLFFFFFGSFYCYTVLKFPYTELSMERNVVNYAREIYIATSKHNAKNTNLIMET